MVRQLTVSDIVALPLVQEALPEVVSPTTADRPVRWVHVSELEELSALLKGGELILTTGIGIGHTDAEQRDYLRNLDRAGAAGLVIELGRQFDQPPRGLARAAEELAFPLVVLHRPLRFVALTEAVHARIIDEQVERLSFSERVHRTFSELAVETTGTEQILHQGRLLAGAPLVLEDLGHRVIAYELGDASAAQVLDQWERRSRASGDGVSMPLGNERWATSLVGPRRNPWGRLVLLGGTLDNDAARTLLERTAQALTVARLVERERRGEEHRTHAGLLAELLAGRAIDGPDLRTRASAAGLTTTGPYLPLTLVPTRGRPTGTSPASGEPPDSDSTARVRDIVAAQLRAAGRPGLVASTQPGTVTAVLGLDTADEDRLLERLAPAVHERIAAEGDGTPWVIGVGRRASTLAGIGPLLDESGHAAETAAAQQAHGPGSRPFHRSADVRLRGVLSLLRDDPRLVAFAEAELGPLLAHDAKHHTTLADLLGEFLRHGGNKTELARRSHLSRPALYNRLATIESVLDLDLADAESRVSLHVAALLRELRGTRGETG
ncbi:MULTISPECIES: PucR family transcriptional regulator ligand-binding domain-containing protein [unclassified Actinopolyspora]|uniref:PucR family transcriptional regulator n=1 Tax=unclassified Actinopolyspora TaxID=2639451 RepID=UPI0013F66184|nr:MULTISPECIES: PucR family transcriptional regulator ligand-binding domain-containing protein [unclassified Actinopolyspora]NHD16169.1 PucR family transcriptional regulator [Actinopolyspora sp. BKK2]NHE74617.1 PucR family transcriptional regulator [Actinopolyspora sp. BKK1]